MVGNNVSQYKQIELRTETSDSKNLNKFKLIPGFTLYSIGNKMCTVDATELQQSTL